MPYLAAADGVRIAASKAAVAMSGTITNILADIQLDDDEAIPLPNVDGPTLAWIMTWCEEKATLPSTQPEEATVKTDARCLALSRTELFDVILAANYLNIESLLKASTKVVADTLKGKTVEEIRKAYGIVNDFTPEEEEAIRRENEWCEER